MAFHFWGKDINNEEMDSLQQARTEFEDAIAPDQIKNVIQTRNLMLYTCTGMLASFDAISL